MHITLLLSEEIPTYSNQFAFIIVISILLIIPHICCCLGNPFQISEQIMKMDSVQARAKNGDFLLRSMSILQLLHVLRSMFMPLCMQFRRMRFPTRSGFTVNIFQFLRIDLQNFPTITWVWDPKSSLAK